MRTEVRIRGLVGEGRGGKVQRGERAEEKGGEGAAGGAREARGEGRQRRRDAVVRIGKEKGNVGTAYTVVSACFARYCFAVNAAFATTARNTAGTSLKAGMRNSV